MSAHVRRVTVRVKVTPGTLPLRQTRVDDGWQRFGRAHFINRLAYEVHRYQSPLIAPWRQRLRRLWAKLVE